MTGYQDENRAKITATQMADSEITDSQLSERARKAPPPKRALTNGVRPRTKPRISPAPPASPASPASPVANSGTASRTAPKRTAPKRKVKASKVQARKAKPAAQSTARSAAPRVRAKASQRARAAPARIAPARTKRPAKSAKIAAKSTAKRTAKVAAKSTAKRTAKSLAKQKAAAPLRPKVSVVIPTYNRARPASVPCGKQRHGVAHSSQAQSQSEQSASPQGKTSSSVSGARGSAAGALQSEPARPRRACQDRAWQDEAHR